MEILYDNFDDDASTGELVKLFDLDRPITSNDPNRIQRINADEYSDEALIRFLKTGKKPLVRLLPDTS